MWTTRDGFVLRLSPKALSRAASAIDRSGLRPLVRKNYRGSWRAALYRSIARLATRARLAEAVQSERTGKFYPAFLSVTPAGTFQFVTRSLGGGHHAILTLRQTEEVESELKVGDPAPLPNRGASANQFHEAHIKRIVKQLKRLGWTDVWVDQPQNAGGKVAGLNRPDISGINPKTGKRFNIEIDTDRQQSARHQRQVVKNDPNATSTFIVIDPRTGRVIGSRVYRPRTGLVHGSRVFGHRTLDPRSGKLSPLRPNRGPLYDIRTGRRIRRPRRAVSA